MTKDLVIGLDSSTQSTKAVAWTATGTPVAEGRADIPLSQPRPGWVEQDVEDWWSAACTALRQLGDNIDMSRVAALAISNQRETVAFLDAGGKAVRPAVVWLDERARQEVELLSEELGRDTLHRVSGKPVDLTPVVYRLSWFRRHQPDVMERTAKIADVHCFLTGRLTGNWTSSWTSADPFGVLDIKTMTWSEDFLNHLDIRAEQLGALARPGTVTGHVTPQASAHTGLPEGLPLIAAGGDGQCAGLGVDAAREGVVYLNLGTALITGAWAPDPMISLNWRTMTSPTGNGYFLEGCQRAGAFLLNWFVDTFAGGREDPSVFSRLEAEAAKIPVGSEGVTVCPYLTGCMDPHWDTGARASFNGLSPTHGLGHLYRAVLEAMTLESARAISAMKENGLTIEKIVAVGGGGNSALWTRMYADATGLPVHVSKSLEASSLGAAMSAACGVGWFETLDEAAASMSEQSAPVLPDRGTFQAWQDLSDRQFASYRPECEAP